MECTAHRSRSRDLLIVEQPATFRNNTLVSIMTLFLCALLMVDDSVAEPTVARHTLPARPLPLSDVRLTGGPLKHAQDLDAKYLLELEPDRMLAYYRERAGLKPKAEPYGGWDGGGRNLTGHIGGHYLSAVSLMWAATGDERFKQRAETMVRELKEVQDEHGDGYLCAFEGGRECFRGLSEGDIRSGGFDLNGLWVPWYTLHKTMAGLRDAYRHTGNGTALEVEVKIAEWAAGILSDLTEVQVQKMLETEFGGMNEVLADLYADTGDDRWLELSYRFEHRAIVDPLKRHQDILPGKHGNTQVPKLVGSAARFAHGGDAADIIAASYFWDRVVGHHSFATGGHGKDEYFGEPDQHNDRIDGRTAESCNVYNMLKLTRRLFSFHPDAHYVEFHERALFNHVLASIDPDDGRTCYMVPVGRGVRHEYSDMQRSFTCCVGTGMESHALHGHGIYYESGDRLWINLYAPSVATWESAGATITMETDFPEGESAKLTVKLEKPKRFTISLRRPAWAGEGFTVSVNGAPLEELPAPGMYVEIERLWKSGDAVELKLPKELRLEPLPDNPRRAAIMWGPLVLAGDLGPEEQRNRERDELTGLWKVPVLVAAERPVAEWLKPIAGRPGCFRSDGVGRDHDAEFMAFYRLHCRTYAVYWDLFTPDEWEQQKAAYTAKQEQQRRLEAATVAFVQPGEMQPERDFNYQAAEGAQVVRLQGRPARRTARWFSFDLPVDNAHPMALVVTYNHDEWRRRTFDIRVNDQLLQSQTIERRGPLRFFDVEYAIPPELVEGKKQVAVRFEATGGNETAAVYGIRMIRADAER
jgi:uncharacterized protein